MKKLFLAYTVIFVLLCASFILLKKAYSEWTEYSMLSQRTHSILMAYQDLAKHITNAAVTNPALTSAQKSAQAIGIFPTNKAIIHENLNKLKFLVRDSVNIKLVKQLRQEVTQELDWIYASNVPDSILHNNAHKHIVIIDSINRIIEYGIKRTRFVLAYTETELNKSHRRLIVLTLVFLILIFSLLVYTIFRLVNQHIKTREKDGQLEQQDVYFKYILDNMMEGVQIHDSSWRYIYVNDALANYSKCSKKELLGYTLMEKYPGIEQTDLFKNLETCMKKRVPKQMETEFVFPDGTRSQFEISIQPVPEGIFILSIDKSEHHKAEEKISAGELKYRNMVETIHESLIIQDVEGKIVYANSEFGKTFGFTPEEFNFLSLKDYISEKSYEKVVERHNKRIQGLPVEDEFVYQGKRKDGTEIWIEARVSTLMENGKIIGTQSLERDITERIIAEEKIKKTSRMFAFLSAINQSIVHTSDENELMDTVSRIATNIGQFKLAYIGLLNEQQKIKIVSLSGNQQGTEKILKMDGLDVNDPVYKNVPTVKVLKTGEYSFNNNMQNDPELSHWKEEFIVHGIHASIALPIFRFGVPIGILGFHAGTKDFFDKEEIELLQEAAGDISFALENFEKTRKHQETEERLLKNEKRFRGIIEKSSDFKTLTDKNGRLTYGSPSVLKAFGYSMEEFLNITAMNFFHPEDVIDLISKRNKILNKPGGSYTFQYRIAHKNGSWIWCEGTVTNFLHEPAIQAMVTNFRDISENKKNALEKERLIKQLTQNNNDLRQFAYITSHNLRGPIANLLGLTNLLDTLKIKDQTLLKILNGIKTATVMFDETIKDLAEVLTVRDNLAILMETLRFEDCFEKVRGLCEKSINESNAEIIYDFSGAPEISFNKAYLESILINLLSNAIKYKEDERALKIDVKTIDAGDHIILRFSDNGIGFDSDMQKEKVFKLYQRFHMHKEGKGLGLFLIKSQLDALGGNIHVESKPNIGSTFTIKFDKTNNNEHRTNL